MKMSIPMSLNLGLSGQPFSGPDMGGYALNAYPELFGQWISIGTFFPFMRGHAEKGTNNKEPWAFGPEIENVSRIALNRRYRLLPYFYTLFHEASITGMPVMRPVFFADSKDVTLRDEEQVFLLGDNLLIIPKWAVNPSLPKGIWRNISVAGEKSTTDNYQADVKLKGGAILPLGKIIQNTTQYSLDSLTLIVSLDKNGKASGAMYEDAGDGFRYQKGGYLISDFTAKIVGSVVKVEITSKEGSLKPTNRKFKIIVITDTGPIESGWIEKNNITVRMPAN